MIESDSQLRQIVNGAPREGSAPRRRRWRRTSLREVGRRLAKPVAVIGALGVAAMLLWPEAPERIDPETRSIYAINVEATRNETPVSHATRLAAPSQPVAPDTVVSAKAAMPAAPPLPQPTSREERASAALALIDQTNADFAERLSAFDLTYQPLALRTPEAWREGGCAGATPPRGPAYCPNDGLLYAEPRVPGGMDDLLSLAHGIGRHIQSQLGLLMPPADDGDLAVQADCFAGLWARQHPDVRRRLYPERLDQELNPGGRDIEAERRVAAFRAGYLGQGLLDCREPLSARL